MYLHMDEKNFENLDKVILPWEEQYGVKNFQNGYLNLVSVGDYRATISAIDPAVNSETRCNMGGNLNLLWHKKYGAICAATMHSFFMVEPTNFQRLRNAAHTECMTPRIICGDYESDVDKTVEISSNGDKNRAEVTVIGNNELNFKIVYVFEGDEVKIILTSEKDAIYKLPIIADNKAEVKHVSDKKLSFNDMLTVSANVAVSGDTDKRYFNQVGGFEYVDLSLPLKSNETTEIKISL